MHSNWTAPRASFFSFSFFPFVLIFLILILEMTGCAIFATRPVQEMSNTVAALKAAKEVQADTYAPELFRQASEWFFKARREYKFKNFKLALEYANRAKSFAEQAEFEAIRNGGVRTDLAAGPGGVSGSGLEGGASGGVASGSETAPAQNATPYDYPTPTGTPATEFEKRKAEEENRMKRAMPEPQSQQSPSSPTSQQSPTKFQTPENPYMAPNASPKNQ